MGTAIALVVLAGVAYPADDDAPSVAMLIEELGSDELVSRDVAAGRLIKIGKPAIAAVRPLLASEDAEVRARARQVLKAIEAALRPSALRLEVSAEKKCCAPGEAIKVEVRLRNVGEFPVIVMRGFERARIALELRQGDRAIKTGQADRAQQQCIAGSTPDRFWTIKPGESVVVDSLAAVGETVEGACKLKVLYQGGGRQRQRQQKQQEVLVQEQGPIEPAEEESLVSECWEGKLEAEAEFEVKP